VVAKRVFVLAALCCLLALVAQSASAGGETGNGKVAASQSRVR
jgi:hypothetical protein